MTISRPRLNTAGVRAAVGLLVWSTLSPLGSAASAREAGPAAPTSGVQVSDALPMSFEPNVGQTDERVRYVARGRGYAVFLTDDAATLALDGGLSTRRREGDNAPLPAVSREALRLRIEGARKNVRPSAERPLSARSNYLVGGDPETWRSDVPTYAAVRYAGVYDGVDAVFYGNQKQLEYDFEVAPGADASQIRLRFEGQLGAEVAENGDLVLRLAGGEVRQQRAAVYQRGETGKQRVEASYEVGADGEVRFALGAYDTARPLVIDPVIVYGTFLGSGRSSETTTAVAADAAGAVYVTGFTSATNFPVTPGAFDTTVNGEPAPGDVHTDAYVLKLAPGGASVVYATYLGGHTRDYGNAIAVDAAGNAYVTGYTLSSDFPTTPGAYDRVFGGPSSSGGGQDAFVTKVSANGSSLVYSTFLGGSGDEVGRDIAVASNGGAIVVGTTLSLDFPTTPGAFDTTYAGSAQNEIDAFVTRLGPSGGSLSYSTYLGGVAADDARGVAVDSSGNAYVAGRTTSSSFPTTPGAFDTTFGNAAGDAFVTKMSGSGALVYSTFVGGLGGDAGGDVAVDAAGNAYVVGGTDSADFPVTPGAYTTGPPSEHGAGFVTKLNAAGSAPVYSSIIAGSVIGAFLVSVAVDASGNAYVAGTTETADFPTTAGAFDTTYNGHGDAVAFRLNAAGSALDFSTYVGGGAEEVAAGIAVDGSARAYVVGHTYSTDFPGSDGAFDPSFDGFIDGFVTRLDAGGALGYSTVVSGTASRYTDYDTANAVAVDASGAVYVAGATSSLSFPTSPGAYDDEFDYPYPSHEGLEVFVSKIAPDGGSLVFSTFLGGLDDEIAYGLAVGPGGEIYVTGATVSADFPATSGAFDTSLGYPTSRTTDAFVTKLAPDGGSLVFSTFLGGSRDDESYGLALHPDGTTSVTGFTASPDYPTTAGAYDTLHEHDDEEDGFLARVSADGSSLVYSTFLGGSGKDIARDVAVDATGAAYVTGETWWPDFPVTAGAFDEVFDGFAASTSEAFVAKVSPGGDALVYSTFVGSDRIDAGAAIAVDAAGAAYVTGKTSSPQFPVTPGAFDTTIGLDQLYIYDAFVAKVDPSGASLVYSTFLGGESSDSGRGLVVGADGVAYVTGATVANDFPTTPDALDTVLDAGVFNQNGGDAFVALVAPDGGALRYSTYLGGSGNEMGWATTLAPDGDLVVVGESRSSDFLTTGFGNLDASNAFVTRLRFGGTAGADTVGIHVASSSAFFLRNTNSAGPADVLVAYGPAGTGWRPLSGDWDGDGDDSLGLYDSVNGVFFLRNSNTPGAADVVFSFGPGGPSVVPVVGDFDGDGDTTVGIYNSVTGAFFLKNSNAGGAADIVFSFGPGGSGIVPVMGDFDGDGDDTVGIYNSTTGAFFLKNSNAGGSADAVFSFGGGGGVVPIFGDFDGDGDDTVGIYNSATGAFFLKNSNAGGAADLLFAYGPGGVTPLVGDWDGL